MCGRFSQREAAEIYAAKVGWKSGKTDVGDGLKYNVPPGTRPIVLHQLGDGSDQIDRLFWGYKPECHKRQPIINARLDKILKTVAHEAGSKCHPENEQHELVNTKCLPITRPFCTIC